MKDPAFLFYSRDFYEGTRLFTPMERAAYIDLLIYQHQNGYIPNDLKRLTSYCVGCNKASLQAILKAKFKLSDEGYYNERLMEVMGEREIFAQKQSINGAVGQFFKKAKSVICLNDFLKLKEALKGVKNSELFEYLKDKKIIDKAMLEAMLKHYAIANAIVLNNSNNLAKEKGVKGGKTFVPDYSTFKPEFQEAIKLWFDYKKEKGKSIKGQIELSRVEKKLENLSKEFSITAMAIVEHSISNGYAGLFAPSKTITNNHEQSKQPARRGYERRGGSDYD